jgi:hypothetical protein
VANVKPPNHYTGTPHTVTLTAGAVLYRVHSKGYPSNAFNPNPCHRYYGGGRFDATDDDPYPFIYAGETIANAVAETLLRDLPLLDTGARILPLRKITGRRISAITITADLELVTLRSGTDLGAVSQDPWLTTCDPRDYAQSRHWGHWIRTHAPAAAGYIWQSRREPFTDSYILFGDRTPPGAILDNPTDPALPPGPQVDFDTRQGRAALRRQLLRYNVTLARR